MNKTPLIAAAVLFSSAAFSHGYITNEHTGESPASRAKLCQLGLNSDCGQITYEPQSVEGAEGFPSSGVPDGRLASADNQAYRQLDEQSSTRWHQQPIQSGMNVFDWNFTAVHITRSFKYFITKSDWNPEAPLTRDQFDLNPFCDFDGGMAKPPQRLSHNCVVPEREGYQVILAYWDVGDTAAAFYNVIDVKFEGDGNTGHGVSISGIQPEYDANSQITLHMDYYPVGDTLAHTFVTNPNGAVVGVDTRDLKDGVQEHVGLTIDGNEVGPYNLNVRLVSEGSDVFTKDYGFSVVGGDGGQPPVDGEFDYQFPDSIGSYTGGTLVLQPKDGNIYECKPFPYSGYCQQYAETANQFEPGVGSHWQDAWTKK